MWELLLSMPTSKTMRDKILTFNNHSETPEWKDLLDSKSPFKLLYSLQIIDAIIFPVGEFLDPTVRANWCIEFVEKGGFLHIFTILTANNLFQRKLSNSQGNFIG